VGSLGGADDGINLLPFIAGGNPTQNEAYADTFLPRDQFQWSELRAVRTDKLKYIAGPRPELYDLTVDPGEQRNIIGDRAAEAERLRRISEMVESRGRSRKSSHAADAGLQEKFRALGYIGYAPGAAVPGSPSADPKDKLHVYARVMTALELSEADKADEALAQLAAAEKRDANVAQIHYLKGSILGTKNRFAEAAAALERAVALNAHFVLARFKLALAYVRLSRFDRAEEILRSVIADEPRNFRAFHNLAAIAYSRGDLAAAEKLERQALAIDPNYFEAWNTLGAIFVVAKRPTEAIDALNTALRVDPSSGQAHYNLSLALRAAGQTAGAEAKAATACALDRRYCRSTAEPR
jgi:tetratricopeptide (TPR) repeat protein